MKGNILFFLIFIVFFQGCQIIEQKRKEKEIEREKIHKRVDEILRQDSIAGIEVKKAIGGIMFGISESEFKEEEELFLNTLYFIEKEYPDRDFYSIGWSYSFEFIIPVFSNDSLCYIELSGLKRANEKKKGFNEYDYFLDKEFYSLSAMLTEKFGSPIINYGSPTKLSMHNKRVRLLCRWLVVHGHNGKKQVDINLRKEGTYYFLDLLIYQPEIYDRLNMELNNKIKEKAKKATIKATELL